MERGQWTYGFHGRIVLYCIELNCVELVSCPVLSHCAGAPDVD